VKLPEAACRGDDVHAVADDLIDGARQLGRVNGIFDIRTIAVFCRKSRHHRHYAFEIFRRDHDTLLLLSTGLGNGVATRILHQGPLGVKRHFQFGPGIRGWN
jgi:hypothetical protein